MSQRVSVIDSHTAGEPTRVVVAGGPNLAGDDIAQQRDDFRLRHDFFRSAICNEPRGSDVMVGALLVPPRDPSCTTGVIFFNNVGYLGMCGHGTIGVMATLHYLNRITPGAHRLETPVGIVTAHLHPSGDVAVDNVPAYRHARRVPVRLPRGQQITGDIAWGGNWFFLCEDHDQSLDFANVDALTEYTWQVRQALDAANIRGRDGAEIDHIELFGPPQSPGADSRNFVLCPGKAYDRSPCGTGTSAKLACLHADGKLAPGQIWRQESIIGSLFEGTLRIDGDRLLPTIQGHAFINAEATFLFHPDDPYRNGIPH